MVQSWLQEFLGNWPCGTLTTQDFQFKTVEANIFNFWAVLISRHKSPANIVITGEAKPDLESKRHSEIVACQVKERADVLQPYQESWSRWISFACDLRNIQIRSFTKVYSSERVVLRGIQGSMTNQTHTFWCMETDWLRDWIPRSLPFNTDACCTDAQSRELISCRSCLPTYYPGPCLKRYRVSPSVKM